MKRVFAACFCLYGFSACSEASAGPCSADLNPPIDSLEELVQFSPPSWQQTSEARVLGALSCEAKRSDFVFERLSRIEGVRVFRGRENAASSTVYVAFIDWMRASLEVRLAAGLNETSRLTEDCLLGLNGGYFSGSQSMSLLVRRGQIVAEDAQRLQRPGGYAYPTRGALAFDFWTGRPQLIWASVLEGELLSYPRPVDPFSNGRQTGRSPGTVFEAFGAGPMLVKDGEIVDTVALEAFDEGIRPRGPNPRSAAALLGSGELLLVVADGRSQLSRGLTLGELSRLLLRLGARDALNLDGGGSSTMTSFGQVLSRPSDGKERSVKSALCIGESLAKTGRSKGKSLER